MAKTKYFLNLNHSYPIILRYCPFINDIITSTFVLVINTIYPSYW